ncbi:RNA polymerase sigma factor [Hyphomonas sp. GM-8P]|uniref:RNA polymerase sigma factor n=1 Tax=Hyphomonas sp. GM-8P TaxID=1280945 RepID=UPI000DD3AD05|nr:sigma-70 family RNA polymerase sigma factor [Hyphomonas sp. GM-8P]
MISRGTERRCEDLSPMVEGALVTRGPSVLNEVFRCHYEQLLRFSQIRIGKTADAEDLVQDAFLIVARAYPDKEARDLKPLLFTVLRNLTLDYLKSGYAKHRRSSAEIDGMSELFACPRTVTPETQVIDTETLAIAEATIAKLKSRQRQALLLSRFERLTHDEIARRLSVSPRTVRTDIANALAEISKALVKADRGSSD